MLLGRRDEQSDISAQKETQNRENEA